MHPLRQPSTIVWYIIHDCIIMIAVIRSNFVFSDKVSNVDIDLENKKVFVTSAMTPEELTETLKKTGKDVTFIGSKST